MYYDDLMGNSLSGFNRNICLNKYRNYSIFKDKNMSDANDNTTLFKPSLIIPHLLINPTAS